MNENEEIEIDLFRIWEIVCVHWKSLVALIGAGLIIAVLITTFLIPKKYTAEAKLIIVQNSSTDNTQMTYNDIQTSQKLVNTYSEILKSEAISDDVIRNLRLAQEGIDHQVYLDMVEIDSVNDTEVIDISVTSLDPQESADIANEIVSVFQRKIVTIMNIENVTVLNSAKVPEEPSSPSRIRNGLIGAAMGLMVDVVIIVVMLLQDQNVKTEEELKKIFDYPIIGMIPDMESGTRGNQQA